MPLAALREISVHVIVLLGAVCSFLNTRQDARVHHRKQQLRVLHQLQRRRAHIMANPYLVQAIYGPQPTTPTMDDAKDASSITEAAAVSTSPYTAGALIETLYGEQRPADAPTSDSVHPAREFLMQNGKLKFLL